MNSEWTPASIRLPDDETIVLVYTPERNEAIWLAYHDDGTWRFVEGDMCNPTHWAELPEPPRSAS